MENKKFRFLNSEETKGNIRGKKTPKLYYLNILKMH